jgi:hypothetical protein
MVSTRFKMGDRVSWIYKDTRFDGNIICVVPSGRDLTNYLPEEYKGKGVRRHGDRLSVNDRYLVLCKDKDYLRFRTPAVDYLDSKGHQVIGAALQL